MIKQIVLVGLDATTLEQGWNDLTNGPNNETEALAVKKVKQARDGKTYESERTNMEMPNVKAAAIVRSKRYDWVDDYVYQCSIEILTNKYS